MRSLIQQLNAKIALGGELVAKLGGFLGPDEPGGRLAALYDAMGATASDTLGASLQNAAAYRAGAGALIKQINQIPALQKAIEDLLIVAPSPTPAPSPSPPPPSASPPPATPTPPPATPSPSSAGPSGSGASASPSPSIALGAEQLTDPDFEAGDIGPPWTLLVAAGSDATVTADTTAPASGKIAARLDITTGSPAYGGISLQQGGLHIEAGGVYVISLSTRAAAAREVRVRITSSIGDFISDSRPDDWCGLDEVVDHVHGPRHGPGCGPGDRLRPLGSDHLDRRGLVPRVDRGALAGLPRDGVRPAWDEAGGRPVADRGVRAERERPDLGRNVASDAASAVRRCIQCT